MLDEALRAEAKANKRIRIQDKTVYFIREGVGSRYGNVIFLNENLLTPEFSDSCEYGLLEFVLLHELKHSERLSFKDIAIDRTMNKGMLFKSFKFMLRHPWALMQLSPLRIFRNPGNRQLIIGMDWITALYWVILLSCLKYLTGLL